MLPVRWCGGLDHQRADHHRNALGHRRLIFTYLIQKKISASPLTKTKAGQKPSYSVVTNCTYDGVCYNAKEAQDLL
ncbi:hypothetical protein MJN99_17635, partial [Salmonella enterica subsp. enterica serovar Cerro]|nr:hypothetical protein [Salmonella enterica subsp. enterica serovar Cerro]